MLGPRSVSGSTIFSRCSLSDRNRFNSKPGILLRLPMRTICISPSDTILYSDCFEIASINEAAFSEYNFKSSKVLSFFLVIKNASCDLNVELKKLSLVITWMNSLSNSIIELIKFLTVF